MDFNKLSQLAKNMQSEKDKQQTTLPTGTSPEYDENIGIEDESDYYGYSDDDDEEYESISERIGEYFDYDVRQIRTASLIPYHNHTFNVNDDEIDELAENIEKFGVLEPLLICISDTYGKYEIVAGHRRLEAGKRVGKETLPCRIAREDTPTELLDEIMVISNLERRNKFSVSELAKSIKVLYEARKHQGYKVQNSTGDTSKDIASEFGITQMDMYRYLRFAELTPYFLKLLDGGKLKKNVAYALSFLDEQEQGIVENWLVQNKKELDKSKADALCKAKKNQGHLDQRSISVILNTPEKEKKKRTYTIKAKLMTKYFSGKTQAEIEQILQEALQSYFASENEREE